MDQSIRRAEGPNSSRSPGPAGSVAASRGIALALRRVAMVVIPGVALLVAMAALLAGRTREDPLRIVMGAAAVVLLAGLASALMIGLSSGLTLLADLAESVGRIEQRVSAGPAEAVSDLRPDGGELAAQSTAAALGAERRRHLDEIRQAIGASTWREAETLVNSFVETYPEDPESTRVSADLAEARRSATNELTAKINAAREVNDPERVIALHDELKALLDPDARRAHESELARWFLALIQRRLRAGTVRPDVAHLAAQVAATLDATPEGASLRASLPTLRRAAGLCARCGQPYRGIADACPSCTAKAIPPAVDVASPP